MNFKEFFFYLLLSIFFPGSKKTMEWRMLRLLNRDRKINGGLQAVRMQEDLREVARKHSGDMAEKDYFDHVNLKSQSPADRLRLAGVSEVVSGENLAEIGGFSNPTQFAETGLMNSPGHRANILNGNYNAVGIGVIQSPTQIYYFTQNFAKRDLIFKQKIPKTLLIGKALHLSGETFSGIKNIYFQIQIIGQPKNIAEKLIPVINKRFDFNISFPGIGVYEVLFFTGNNKNASFTLANRASIKVHKSFWGRMFG